MHNREGSYVRNLGQQVFVGVLVTLAVSVVGAIAWTVWDYVNSSPLTTTLNPSASGEPVRVRGLFDRQIEPSFHEACSRPWWSRCYRSLVFKEHCRKLYFDPIELRDMYTHRVPKTFSGNAEEILQEFVSVHSHCIALREEGDNFTIVKSENSKLQQSNGVYTCE